MAIEPRDVPALPAQAPPDLGGPHAPVSGETEPLVLSRGNLFCVVNRRGDIFPPGARDLGLFHEDTRHLSRLELLVTPRRAALDDGVGRATPATVLSAATSGGSLAQVDLTITDREIAGLVEDPQHFLHLRRRQLLDDLFVERIAVTNHLRRPIEMSLELRFDADFADIFEVRGVRRPHRGELLQPSVAADRVTFGYLGLDGATYRTVVHLLPEPATIVPLDEAGATPMAARFNLSFQPGETTVLELTVLPQRTGRHEAIVSAPAWRPFDVRLETVRHSHQSFLAHATRLRCDDNRFEAMLARGLTDIDSLRLHVRGHSIVGAGIPWFAAPFGRDSIIAALETLAVAPELAVETLRTLAAFQGEREDAWREEEPGKIMHELRRGELARAGEVPHSPYYGSIDATPLWLMLLVETWRWTGDDQLLDELMPHAERALAWIERRLVEGGGLLRYQRRHARGLENQGWKDSRDGVSFPDGTIAEPPIALVEVQGYVVAALDAMTRIRRRQGNAHAAHQLRQRALELRRRIEEVFWVEETRYYALAIDGQGRRVSTVSSNPGHLAFCRALQPGRGERLGEVLLGDGLYSGWGVRTVARGQAVYNPLSYHNGTVWPHDNALCALGLAMSNQPARVDRIFEGLYAAALHFRDQRLPELFCGLARGEGDFLVHYPVSCSPQAWASGAFFLLLQASLGLYPDAPLGRLTIRNPHLPSFLRHLELAEMRVGRALVSLRFGRHNDRTHVDLVELRGPLKVNIEIW